MEASAIGYFGIALTVLGALVWIFRPNQVGDIEFDFLGFKARANTPALAVMAFGLILTIAGYSTLSNPPSPENCHNISGAYDAKEKLERNLVISQTGCFFHGSIDLDTEQNTVIGQLFSDSTGVAFVISNKHSPECTAHYFATINNIT